MQSAAEPGPTSVRFGPFELNLQRGELLRDGKLVVLQDKPLQLLIALVEHPGKTITREQLRIRLWPDDSFGSFDDGLNTAIRKLRQALVDSATNPAFIETIPRHGYRFVAPIEETEARATPTRSAPLQHRRTWLVFGCVVVVISALLLVSRSHQWRTKTAEGITSIAVMPLEQLSGDSAQEYLADGMTEALTTSLGKIKALRVISHNSAMQFKGKHLSTAKIAGDLAVDAIVEGSVTRVGSRVRITAQLIDVRDDRHLWADSYEGDASDILKLQSAVAERIAEQIRSNLSPADRKQFTTARAVNPQAYEEYLRGRYFWNKYTEDGWRTALAHFNSAISLEPEYAAAYAGLADCYLLLGAYLYQAPREVMPLGISAARKALELDPQLAEAHYSLAFAKTEYEYDWTGAEGEFQLGLAVNPNYAIGRMWHSLLLSVLGRHDEAIAEELLARSLDPVSLIINTNLCRAYVFARRFDEAIVHCQQTLQLDPRFSIAAVWLAMAYEQKKMFDAAYEVTEKALMDADDHAGAALVALSYRHGGQKALLHLLLSDALARYDRTRVGAIDIASLYARLGRNDKALEYLNNSYLIREPYLSLIGVSPDFAALHSDKRFSAVLQRMNLVR